MQTRLCSLAILVVLIFASVACYHPDPYVRHGRRTGAAVGAVGGAIIGNNVRGISSWEGAAIGGAVGALAGDRRGKINSMYYGGGRRPYYY